MPTAFAENPKVKIVADPFPPWIIVSDDGRVSGIAVDIADRMFSDLGYSYEISIRPFARALHELKAGQHDIMLMLTETEERQKTLVFTSPVYHIKDYLFYNTKAHPNFAWQELKDLKAFKIGSVIEYTYGDSWENGVKEHQLDIEPVPSVEINMKKLVNGRVDLVISNPIDTAYWLKFMGENPEVVDYHRSEIFSFKARLGISKSSPLANELDQLNKSLKVIVAKDSLAPILKKHIGAP